jgi:hypothetical protein
MICGPSGTASAALVDCPGIPQASVTVPHCFATVTSMCGMLGVGSSDGKRSDLRCLQVFSYQIDV